MSVISQYSWGGIPEGECEWSLQKKLKKTSLRKKLYCSENINKIRE